MGNIGILRDIEDIIFEEKILLYHGSKGGIVGDIEPFNYNRKSHSQCDFGIGFYMGNSEKQAKALVSDDSNPYFYKLELDLTKFSPERILLLQEKEWLLTVLANRKGCKEYNSLNLAKYWANKMNEYDLIVGLIADDSMEKAMSDFMNHNMTDVGLYNSLKEINLGLQVVAKTEFACKQIKILEEKALFGQELKNAASISRYYKQQGSIALDRCKRQYRKQGVYLDELIECERKYGQTNEWRNSYE